VARPQSSNGDLPSEALDMIDEIFLCNSFREARSLAVRELALDDGTRVLPEEVKLSFQEKARAIMRLPSTERRAANAVWLNLITLCLCAEVLCHLKPSCQGRPAGPPASARPLGLVELGLPMPISGDGTMLASASGSNAGVNFFMARHGHNGMNIMLISDFAAPANSDQMASIRGSGLSGLAGAGTGSAFHGGGHRVDPMFLRERVHAMLEILALSSMMQGRPVTEGMTPGEVNRCCPVTNFQGTESTTCPVCLEEMEVGARVRSLPCGHALHVECCDAWLATAETCPTCRHQLAGRSSAG